MYVNKNELDLLKKVDICEIDKNELVDIRDICVDTKKPLSDRISEFVEKVRNPYCFRVGDIAVKVEFEKTEVTFEQRFENLLANQ